MLPGSNVELLVVTRHQVVPGTRAEFLEQARDALAALGEQVGYLSGCIAQSTDDADLFVIESRWVDVGSYRRALSSFDVKMRAIPFLYGALDEPSSFEIVVSRTPAGETTDRTGLADDARAVSLGEAAAPRVDSATP